MGGRGFRAGGNADLPFLRGDVDAPGTPTLIKGFENKAIEANRAAVALRKQIQDDETITDQTRRELLASIDPAKVGGRVSESEVGGARQLFEQARSGKGKFKSRQFTQAQRKILTDRPGNLQTLLTAPTAAASAAPALITGS